MSMTEELNKKDIEYLKENITKLEKSVTDGFARIDARLDLLNENYMKRDEIEKRLESKADKKDVDNIADIVRLKASQKDVESILDNQKWVTRIVVGAVLVALIALIIK